MHIREHLKTVNRHRRLVRRYCFKLGLYWQGLTHDLSKYSPTEFWRSAKYYQGFRSPNDQERSETGVSLSWLHHKGRNRHHFEYWTDYLRDGSGIGGVEMPKKYVAEMFCDRLAASKVYRGKDFQPGDRVLVPAITPDWSSLEAQAGYAMHSGGMLAGWKFSNIKDGVFAEYFHVNDADGNLAHLPEGMDILEACMLSDMVPTGFHGAELADVQFGDTVLVVGIGPVGLMSVAGAALRGAARILAVGTRPVCVEAARRYGASDFISYKDGPIDEQVLELTGGKGVDCAIIAGGDADTFIPVIKALKPGGNIGNVNYLGSGEYVRLPRAEWGVGMGHKQINGGLMPGGRLRMEKLAALMTNGRLDVKPLITHVYDGWDALPQALRLMKDKPRDLIKPVVRL